MLRSTSLFALFLLASNQFITPSVGQSTPQTDCALRQLTVDYVAKLQTNSLDQSTDQTSWASYAFDAMRLGAQCNKTKPSEKALIQSSEVSQWDDYVGLFPAADTVPAERRQSINQVVKQSRTAPVDCALEIFVDNKKSTTSAKSSIKGSFDAPVATIQEALQMVRVSRDQSASQQGDQFPQACITIREGVYYLGNQTNSQTVNSRHGAIHLTERDSNLSIRAYSTSQSNNQDTQYEKVVLSGGVPLMTDWQPYKNGIFQTKINQPLNPEWAAFNELYIGISQSAKRVEIGQTIRRAIRAKAPNGDPATNGMYNNPHSWLTSVKSWLPPRKFSPSTDMSIDTPFRHNSTFSNFRLGFDGPASVFNPKNSIWAQKNPNAGSQYTVPTGLVYDQSIHPIKQYSNPQTGFVHAFHADHWGSWVFQIDDINQSNDQATIAFGRGGHQEARGANTGAEWYLDNLFEELDDDLEWFFDAPNSILYFQPNATDSQSIKQSIKQSMPDLFVASQIPCLISVVGSSNDQPITDIRLEGLVFTQTSNTYMADYRVPSGGDWSVHTGATVYLSNTESVILSNNQFTQLGSNAVTLFGYNADSLIDSNSFSWLGDSGIVLCGTTDGIDGMSSNDQPINSIVASNHFRETGIYIKQTSPIVQFLSRSPTYIGNAMYNMPRAGINVNDGFAGDMVMIGNAIFNSVRETSDHGPFNSWDRQPYLTLQSNNQSTDPQPTLLPSVNKISGNLLFNSYHSVWPIDHDDGSCYYEDSFNLLIYGGYKNYLGHSKSVHDNLYLYPDSKRFDTTIPSVTQSMKHSKHYQSTEPIDQSVEQSLQDIPWGTVCAEDAGPQRYVSGWDENWYNNECHLSQSGLVYNMNGCDVANLFVTNTYNNTLYVPAAQKPFVPCTQDGKSVDLSLDQWQALGQDQETTWHFEQPFDVVLNKARVTMGLPKVGPARDTSRANRHRQTKMIKMLE